MLNERETFQPTFLDSNPTEIRQPYNVLQSIASGQKEVVPGVRIGTNVIGSAGKFEKVGQKEQKPKSNTMLKIFEVYRKFLAVFFVYNFKIVCKNFFFFCEFPRILKTILYLLNQKLK